MADLAQQLAPYLPLAAALLLGLALIIAWWAFRVARDTRVRSGPYDEPEVGGESTADLVDLTSSRPSTPLRRSFARFRRLLRTVVPGLGADYRRPWVLALGQSRAGKTTLLGRTGLGLRYGQPGPTPDPEQAGINWWAFDGGLVLDVVGDGVLRRDGRTSDRTEWRGLLRLIRRSRPRRPIDAVLLTLPASELVDAGKPVAQRLAEASRRAAILHHKLSQAQSTLGMSFPIYLLVSRCDLLPGFATLPAALSPWRRQQMFGWSSPHTPRTTYSGAWIDRAFAELRRDLESFQLEALARGRLTSGIDELVHFPDHFQELHEPLRVYCNHLFSPKAGVEPLMFRGLYFCGAADPARDPDTPQEAPAVPGAVPDVVLVGDLLERKVFPEAGLARPTERAAFGARLRRAGLAAVTAAALLWLAVGLWPAAHSLKGTMAALDPPVERITGTLRQVERDPSRVDPAPPPTREMAREVLTAGSQIEHLSLRSARLPASWLSPLPGRLEGSLRDAMGEVVFPAIRSSLVSQVEKLAATAPAALRSPLRGMVAIDVQAEAEDSPAAVPAAPRSPLRGVVAIEALPQFEDLDHFTRELAALEELIARYRRFAAPAPGDGVARRLRSRAAVWFGGGRAEGAQVEHLSAGGDPVSELNQLSTAVLSSELRPAPGARQAWSRLLGELEVPDLPPGENKLDERLRKRTEEYAEKLFEAVFKDNPLDGELKKVSLGLAQLTPLRPSAKDELEAYRELLRGLKRLRGYLELQAVQWLAADRPSLGRDFDEILFRIHGSQYLGPELAIKLRDRARQDFQRLQSVLEAFGTGYTGSLLTRADETFVLSRPVVEITEALKVLLDEPFMQPQRGQKPIAEAPADRVLRWRDQPLAEALSLVRSYQAYRAPDGSLTRFLDENELSDLPRPLRGTEPVVTRESLVANVLDLIAEAQVVEPAPLADLPEVLELGIRRQIKNLQAVEQDLTDLMAALGELESRADSERLAQILRGQQIAILDQLDLLLADLDPYRPRGGGFAWWDGASPPAPEAFDAATADDLAAYLAAERQTVARLSGEYAQPLLSLFGASRSRALERQAPQTATWQNIATDLSDYTNQAAGNPVSVLEGLISGELAEIDLFTCFDRLKKRPPSSQATDFFRARTYGLRQLLLERCSRLADEEGYRRYLELARFFNRKLAGSFPFAAPSAVDFAEPEAIRELFENEEPGDGDDKNGDDQAGPRSDFARALYLVRNLPDPSPRFGDQRGAVQTFMERMEKVRRFFDVFLAPDAKVKVPVYDLDVRFRVMRGSEQGANQILQWELRIGDQEIDLLHTRSTRPDSPETPEEPSGRWVWDETPAPLRLVVRWASGSPFSPQAAQPVERVTIDDKTLTFTYRGPWSLLRLLKEHPTPAVDFRDLDDPRPETIKLEIVTVSDDEPRHRATATLYSRIVLLDPTDKKELELPVFPAFAPDFDQGRY